MSEGKFNENYTRHLDNAPFYLERSEEEKSAAAKRIGAETRAIEWRLGVDKLKFGTVMLLMGFASGFLLGAAIF